MPAVSFTSNPWKWVNIRMKRVKRRWRRRANRENRRRENNNENAPAAPSFQLTSLQKFILYCVVWSLGMWAAVYVEFGLVYVAVSGLVLMFMNTSSGASKGGFSAYSVFNKDGYRLPGMDRPAFIGLSLRRSCESAIDDDG